MINGITRWLEERVLMLVEDGGTIALARGYKDYALGNEPDYASVAGEPFAANHYHEGYGLAQYELGNRIGNTARVA